MNNYSGLIIVQNDNNALNLVNFIDENKIVDVFVGHEKVGVSNNEFDSESKSVKEPSQSFPSINEPLHFVGDDE